ncbi:DNA repair protein REV1 [Cercospora zeina]
MGSRLEQKSNLVRKRIEQHEFAGETGEEYEPSKFGGFSDYFRRKKIKLQNLDADLRAQSKDKPQIFKGVVCHINGYTQPSLNDLHTMIVQHGGGFIQYLDGKTMVTHIIASNLTPKKKEEFRRYRIVKPAWVVDSIKAGKLLPWDVYRVVDEGVGQKVLGFDNGQVVSQANRKTQGYREQTEASWYTSQFRASQASAPRRPPVLTQTITPDIEDIEEDEYGVPEITSSVEQALQEADRAAGKGKGRHEEQEFAAAPQTPPSTSPPQPPEDDSNVVADTRSLANIEPEPPPEKISALRPREGSQEPDYSHSLISNSDVLKNVSPSRLAAMTAEEHNALILSDPKIRKSTVVHPDFLDQYYRESRLHHLSTWKADLKSQLQALAAQQSSSQKAKQKRQPGQRKYVMHVDFDSFFAAISLKKHPQYKDKPAAVAHGGGSGSEIASCNYPARKFGVSNGMWMKRAQELCPNLKILPYDFPGYEDASREFYNAIMATGGVVQSVSIDEALVDISVICFAESGTDGVNRAEGAVHREQSVADQIAQRLRDEVSEKTGCAVSIGIGSNILQAKVALRKAKPAGQYQLKPEEVLDFIGELEVQKLPGVAWSIGGKLEEIGIKLVKDIRETSKDRLVNTLGPKTGEKIYEYARGIDKAEVGDQVVRKSVSAEVNWGVRFENQDQVDEFMNGLSGELQKRLAKERVKGRQLTMKVMKRAADAPLDPPKHLGHGKCDVFNKSLQLGVATNDHAVIAKETVAMMKSFGISPGELRGIGIQMQKLEAIKVGAEGADQGSQRRLQFKPGPPKPVPNLSRTVSKDDPIQDEGHTPPKERIAEANRPSAAFRPVAAGTPTKKPLNILGTQFVMPTQVDPAVLAELPEDIRARLARQPPAKAPADNGDDRPPEPDQRPKLRLADASDSASSSRAQSPASFIPPQSQIDPSILEALPEDLRAEVLGYYKQPAGPSRRGDQAVLPQSPRKTRTLPPAAPAKRGRGRPRGAKNLTSRLRSGANEHSTLTQSNFVALPAVAASTEPEEIDPEVLAALPEELRQEILAQQRRERLQRQGGLGTSLHQRSKNARAKKTGAVEGRAKPRRFVLPPRPPNPTFTSQKLSTLPELRSTVSAWFQEFSDEPPYPEDVDSLITYLKAVVVEERDLDKAVSVVNWMAWVLDDSEDVPEDVMNGWEDALGRTRKGVQEAATKRDMGTIKFD